MIADDAQIRKQSVDTIIRAVTRKTALIVLLVAAGVLLFGLIRQGTQPPWFLPASVVFGGILGLMNFRWLAIAVQRVYLKQGATRAGSNMAAVIISILKLSVIFIILFIVIKGQLINIFGLVGGLTLSFLAIIWEGISLMRQNMKSGEGRCG